MAMISEVLRGWICPGATSVSGAFKPRISTDSAALEKGETGRSISGSLVDELLGALLLAVASRTYWSSRALTAAISSAKPDLVWISGLRVFISLRIFVSLGRNARIL